MNRYVVGGVLLASAIGALPVLPWWAWLAIGVVVAFLVGRRVRRTRVRRGDTRAAE
jgi:uncharacterized membrane protein